MTDPLPGHSEDMNPPLARERFAARSRLQALSGATVRGRDGESVGRVRDIYLQDATGELAAITVARRQLSSRSVLIPASAIAVLPAEHPDEAEAADGSGSAGNPADGSDGDSADGNAPDADGERSDDGNAPDADRERSTRRRRGRTTPHPGHPQALWLLVDADVAREGITAPDTAHATPEMLREAARVLGIEEAPAE
ncbi:PRC-barrel domain-containing protein [Brachybacterium sp. GCM10030267]|uniref:PRC-barrel domain-containing protein n=1 Tax=Brachybacterium sp. GCM10030267 TaxID=3273381 RepID=UPI00361AFC01